MRSTNGENGRESLRVIGARPRLNRTTLSWTFRPEDRFDREKVNEAALKRQESVWIYEHGHKRAGDVDWIKVFAT
ncbi:hypothetical protein IVB27_24590 [Bradyrhizobium sp. 197]|uniref:hypothetical protein n=1 Tax=Bradyrhizobium sp. 197 TaxID=2782663 RepID=UPI001FFB2B0A|nr:hypothetical protein [Bradyrhizobium sp. 197]MCK1477892.1 hypothetical protein [Bradyrhizobium sp. 197]